MARLVYLLPLAVFVVIAAYLALGLGRDPSVVSSVLIGKPVPSFALAPIKGSDRGFSSDDLLGEVALVNVFGSWCVACRVEHPFLMNLKKNDVIPVYGIDWREEDPDAGPAWLKRRGDPYTLTGDDPDSKAAIAFGVTGAPETFVVDRQGVIRYKHIGPLTAESWTRTLWPMIEELRAQ